MRMVKIVLVDGTSKTMSANEFNSLTIKDRLFEVFNGKMIMDVKFFQEDGR